MPNTLRNFQASKSPIPRAWRNDAFGIDAAVVGILTFGAWTAARRDWFSFGSDLSAVKATLYPTEAQVFAAVLGFLIAGAAVLVASANLERLKVGSFQLYKLLAQSFRDSMFCLIGGIAYAVGAMIFDQGAGVASWAAISVGILILVLLRVARAVRRLYLTLLI